MNTKHCLFRIEALKKQIQQIGAEIEQERKESNDEETAIILELQSKQEFLQKEIEGIKNLLKRDEGPDSRYLGTKYKLYIRGAETVVILTSAIDADPSVGKISIHSPLGKALVDARDKDCVEIDTPVGKAIYRIIQITGPV